MRPSGRAPNEMRHISFTRNFTKHAEGSVLVAFGDTQVICTATVEDGSPRWMGKDAKGGWVTAEYGMLPRATGERNQREASRGKQGGRTLEIQRLIGRSLRAALDMSKLGEYTLFIDCDVIQADGGTRTASITGAMVAVQAKVGDKVTAGQTLVIMEAMKMEHAIKAPADGVVSEIFFAEGDQVSEGAELIAIDVAEEGAEEGPFQSRFGW